MISTSKWNPYFTHYEQVSGTYPQKGSIDVSYQKFGNIIIEDKVTILKIDRPRRIQILCESKRSDESKPYRTLTEIIKFDQTTECNQTRVSFERAASKLGFGMFTVAEDLDQEDMANQDCAKHEISTEQDVFLEWLNAFKNFVESR